MAVRVAVWSRVTFLLWVCDCIWVYVVCSIQHKYVTVNKCQASLLWRIQKDKFESRNFWKNFLCRVRWLKMASGANAIRASSYNTKMCHHSMLFTYIGTCLHTFYSSLHPKDFSTKHSNHTFYTIPNWPRQSSWQDFTICSCCSLVGIHCLRVPFNTTIPSFTSKSDALWRMLRFLFLSASMG